jgi:hypothetical protein
MVAEVSLGPRSRQVYFLVEQTGGEFGTGTGEEFAPTNLDDPRYGVYTPIWMPVSQLMQYTNIYPSAVAELVTKSLREGWASSPIYASETPQ